jgi:hypothetical protein
MRKLYSIGLVLLIALSTSPLGVADTVSLSASASASCSKDGATYSWSADGSGDASGPIGGGYEASANAQGISDSDSGTTEAHASVDREGSGLAEGAKVFATGEASSTTYNEKVKATAETTCGGDDGGDGGGSSDGDVTERQIQVGSSSSGWMLP